MKGAPRYTPSPKRCGLCQVVFPPCTSVSSLPSGRWWGCTKCCPQRFQLPLGSACTTSADPYHRPGELQANIGPPPTGGQAEGPSRLARSCTHSPGTGTQPSVFS